ncbi:MAG: Crp/Fnr family transcriptional regulator [Kordia sp.]|uniref:Crp/Fnr family transcriptional regulator n=1 Tax=Kordia sp. TaxID=1965332 RepID=UPI00385A7A21
MKSIKIPKGTILLRPNEICKSGYKVKMGCLKSYVINSSGKEHIIQFAPENWLISDLESFTKGTKSKIFIDAVEDSEVEILDKNYFPEFEEMEHVMLLGLSTKLRNNLIATNNRLISLLSSTSEERYFEFTKTYPQLVQRLPQKLIASYLGMTPEHLSYIKGKLAKKG